MIFLFHWFPFFFFFFFGSLRGVDGETVSDFIFWTPKSLQMVIAAMKLPAGSTHSSTRGLRPPKQLERPAGFPSSDKTRPDSPVPTLQGPCGRSPKRRGILSFLSPLEVRPSSIAPNPDESREAPPNSTVSLNSQRHLETLPDEPLAMCCKHLSKFVPCFLTLVFVCQRIVYVFV